MASERRSCISQQSLPKATNVIYVSASPLVRAGDPLYSGEMAGMNEMKNDLDHRPKWPKSDFSSARTLSHQDCGCRQAFCLVQVHVSVPYFLSIGLIIEMSPCPFPLDDKSVLGARVDQSLERDTSEEQT